MAYTRHHAKPNAPPKPAATPSLHHAAAPACTHRRTSLHPPTIRREAPAGSGRADPTRAVGPSGRAHGRPAVRARGRHRPRARSGRPGPRGSGVGPPVRPRRTRGPQRAERPDRRASRPASGRSADRVRPSAAAGPVAGRPSGRAQPTVRPSGRDGHTAPAVRSGPAEPGRSGPAVEWPATGRPVGSGQAGRSVRPRAGCGRAGPLPVKKM
jgi:hypothetical protein